MLLLVLLASGCKHRNGLSSDGNRNAGTIVDAADKPEFSDIPADSRVLFVNYTIVRNANGGKDVLGSDFNVVEGKVKGKPMLKRMLRPGDLWCVQLDPDGQRIDSIPVLDPLNFAVEYVNEEGVFAQQEIALDSAELPVRMQLLPAAQSIALEEMAPEGQSNKILIVKELN